MSVKLGKNNLQITVSPLNHGQFNRKIVLENLENILSADRIYLSRVETRQSGRYSPVAIRVRSNVSLTFKAEVPVDIIIVEHSDQHFNRKIVFYGLEEELEHNGLIIESCETRLYGLGTPLAVRVKV